MMDYARENAICALCAPRAADLLASLGADLRPVGKSLLGPCPLHGGDRADALCVYTDGHTAPGLWCCRTRGCEAKWGRSLVSLARGLLSLAAGREVTRDAAARYACAFAGADWDSLKGDAEAEARRQFAAADRPAGDPGEGWDPAAVRARLRVPSPYFVGRGFLASTLESFGVGEATAGPLAGRAVAPVLDPAGRLVAGAAGRSTWPRCPPESGCGRWHDPAEGCPTADRARLPEYAKWRNTAGFRREFHLYNFARALPAVNATKAVVLVEGPGDVWRLAEGGVTNAVALMGVTLADPQQALLEGTHAMAVVVLTDADGAGEHAHAEIRKKLGRGFRLSFPKTRLKDAGSYSAEEVKNELAPALAAAGGYTPQGAPPC
jgi:5S rRNA maturation endonuclease (ribonuclease M5)